MRMDNIVLYKLNCEIYLNTPATKNPFKNKIYIGEYFLHLFAYYTHA